MSITSEEVKAEAKRWGARIVGIGSVDRWMNAPKGHKPKDFLPKARSVVVFGIPQFKAMAQWRNFMKGSEIVPRSEGGGVSEPFNGGSSNICTDAVRRDQPLLADDRHHAGLFPNR